MPIKISCCKLVIFLNSAKHYYIRIRKYHIYLRIIVNHPRFSPHTNKCKLELFPLLRKTQFYFICIKQQQGFRIDNQIPQKNGLLPGRAKGTEKGKEERDGKSRQEASEETASKVLCPAFGALQPACKRKSPVLTELLPYQGTNSLDGLPPRQKGNKKRGYPRLDRNILSYLKKRRLPTLPLCRQYHRRERA